MPYRNRLQSLLAVLVVGLTTIVLVAFTPSRTVLPGGDGLSCWDSNGNGEADPGEDTNGDSVYDAADCIGPAGTQGSSGLLGLETVWGDWTARDMSREKFTEVSCPEGKLPINGGYELALDGNPGPDVMFIATQNSPSFVTPSSWYVKVLHTGSGGIGFWAVRAHAICVSAN